MDQQPLTRTQQNKREYPKLRFAAWLYTFAIALTVSFVLYAFVFQEVRVTGCSMQPTFNEGEVLLVNRLSLYIKSVQRGQIVIFRNKSNGEEYIKRVVGLPGERVQILEGSVYIDGMYLDESDYLAFAEGELNKITVPEGHVFLLGDNRAISLDSRDESVGCVPLDALDGSVMLRLLPIESFTVFLVVRG